MMKKLIITMSDASTGEIFSSNQNTRFVSDDRIAVISKQWLDSLLRGVSSGRELCLTIGIKNNPVETIDDLFVNVHNSDLTPVVESINCPY